MSSGVAVTRHGPPPNTGDARTRGTGVGWGPRRRLVTVRARHRTREVCRVPAPQPTQGSRLARPERRGGPPRAVRRSSDVGEVRGRGLERASCGGRQRERKGLPLPRVRPDDPGRRAPRGGVAGARGRRRSPALAPGVLEREGPPHREGAAARRRSWVAVGRGRGRRPARRPSGGPPRWGGGLDRPGGQTSRFSNRTSARTCATAVAPSMIQSGSHPDGPEGLSEFA